MSYFVFHAIKGKHGLEARSRLQSRATLLQQNLSRLEAIRARLRRDVALLDDRNLDPDMLDQQARAILNFAHPQDVVIFTRNRR